MKKILIAFLFTLATVSQAAVFPGGPLSPGTNLQVGEASGRDILNCLCATQINSGGYLDPACENVSRSLRQSFAGAGGGMIQTMAPNPNAPIGH